MYTPLVGSVLIQFHLVMGRFRVVGEG